MQRWRNVRGSQEAQASGREWRLRFYKRHGFLQQTYIQHIFIAQSLYCNNALDHNSVTKPSASLHNTIFFCSCNEGMGMMPPLNAEMAERTAALRNLKLLTGWMLGIPQRNSGNGPLKQTCPTNLLLAVRHILRISAAQRLAATRPTHCC